MIKNEKYDVTGMSCAACVAHVNKAVEGVEGVTSSAPFLFLFGLYESILELAVRGV